MSRRVRLSSSPWAAICVNGMGSGAGGVAGAGCCAASRETSMAVRRISGLKRQRRTLDEARLDHLLGADARAALRDRNFDGKQPLSAARGLHSCVCNQRRLVLATMDYRQRNFKRGALAGCGDYLDAAAM